MKKWGIVVMWKCGNVILTLQITYYLFKNRFGNGFEWMNEWMNKENIKRESRMLSCPIIGNRINQNSMFTMECSLFVIRNM